MAGGFLLGARRRGEAGPLVMVEVGVCKGLK